MSKDKPTPFLAIKMWNFYTTLNTGTLYGVLVIFFTHSHLFLYSIFSTSVTTSYYLKSSVTVFFIWNASIDKH